MGKYFFLVGAAVAVMVSTASAQTRVFSGEITAGSIMAEVNSWQISGTFDLAGDGFHIVALVTEPGVPASRNCMLEPSCTSGTEMNLSAFYVGGVSGFTLVRSRVTINGETLENAQIQVHGYTVLEAGTVVIPRGNRRNLLLSAPFRLVSGLDLLGEPQTSSVFRITIFPEDMPVWGEPWAEGELTGDGVVTAVFDRFKFKYKGEPGSPTWWYYSLRSFVYSFNEP